MKLKCDEPLSNVAFKFNLRPCILPSRRVANPSPPTNRLGLTLVHFSAQPEPLCH